MKTKEKVQIKLSSELKHAAKNQEDPEDQQEDVASNVERYTWKTQNLKANLVHGKFTEKEDEELKKAIFYHIGSKISPATFSYRCVEYSVGELCPFLFNFKL